MRRNSRTVRLVLGAVMALVLAATAACGGDAGEGGDGSKETVSVGWVPTVAWIGWLATADTFEHEEFQLELLDFKSSSDTMVSLTNGSIDIGAVGYNVLADGLVQADLPLQYIAGASSNSAVVLVKPDSGIESWEDLKGRSVGNVRGSAEYIHLSGALEGAGLDVESDTEYVNFQSGTEVLLALQRGDIDATITFEPLASQAELGGFGERVDAMQETLFSNSFEVSSGILATNKFVEDHPEWAESILTEYSKQMDSLAEDPERALEIYLKYASGDEKVIEASLQNVVLDYNLDEQQIRAVAKTLNETGQLDQDVSDKLVEHLNYEPLAAATGKSPAELGQGG
ncbi:MAG: ABC transporter substrate-binding protein [Propionibacteriaceae bacterium]